MTHDSIGLGEDGPTHQPVEHLAALRAMPNLNVFRPADPIECAECWELALLQPSTPSILALTRQGVPAAAQTRTAENLSAKGAYVLVEADGKRDVTHARHGLGGLASPSRRAERWPRKGSRRPSSRCPAGNCSRCPARDLSDQGPGHGAARRRRSGGRVRLGAMARRQGARSSACTDSAPRPRRQQLYKHFGITAEAVEIGCSRM